MKSVAIYEDFGANKVIVRVSSHMFDSNDQ